VTKTDKIRNNIRFEFVCGGRAIRDYAGKTRSVRSIAGLCSVHEKDAAASVEKSQSELKNLKKRTRKLEERLALYEAQEVIRSAEGMIIQSVFEDRSSEEAKLLALNIIKKGRFVVLYGVKEEERSRIILACAESLGFDMRTAAPAVTSVLAAKGGGGPTLVELVSPEKERLAEALAAASRFIRENLKAE